jgi:hypothetical protein
MSCDRLSGADARDAVDRALGRPPPALRATARSAPVPLEKGSQSGSRRCSASWTSPSVRFGASLRAARQVPTAISGCRSSASTWSTTAASISAADTRRTMLASLAASPLQEARRIRILTCQRRPSPSRRATPVPGAVPAERHLRARVLWQRSEPNVPAVRVGRLSSRCGRRAGRHHRLRRSDRARGAAAPAGTESYGGNATLGQWLGPAPRLKLSAG